MIGSWTRTTLAVALAVATPSVARAQASESSAARAERLFHDGKAALEAGRYGEACPELAESQRLDPATGTLFALGMCHQAEGKTATAWRELQRVVEASTKSGRTDRVELASDLLRKLEPRLSNLTVRVADSGPARDGIQVRLDGEVLASSQWNKGVPVDPGDHTVEAVLAGSPPWRASVHIGGDGEARAVDIPSLQPQPAPAETPPASETTPSPSTPARDRTLGWIVGGAGFAALGVGAAFGVIALSDHSDAKSKCPSSPCSNASGVQQNDNARTFAWVSDVGVGLGIVGVGVGAYLLFWPRGPPQSTSARLVPSVGPGGGGVTVSGAW